MGNNKHVQYLRAHVIIHGLVQGVFFRASTRDEAVRNVREAIEVYLEDCRDAGDPIPTESGKVFIDVEVPV